MIRNDGNYVIYCIQHKYIRETKWVNSIENTYYFKASTNCWQQTGIHGTYDLDEARQVLLKSIVKHNEELQSNKNTKMRAFRIVKLSINQLTEEIN